MSKDVRRIVRIGHSEDFALNLPAEERSLLSTLPQQLHDLLDRFNNDGVAAAEAVRRLFPRAYPKDIGAEAAFSAAHGKPLMEHHEQALTLLAETAHNKQLTAEELEGWLSAVNSLRLVLGTALDVNEEQAEIDRGDPDYAEWVCYHYLSFMQGEVVDALTGILPPPTDEDDLPEDPWGDPPGGLRWDGTEQPGEAPQP